MDKIRSVKRKHPTKAHEISSSSESEDEPKHKKTYTQKQTITALSQFKLGRDPISKENDDSRKYDEHKVGDTCSYIKTIQKPPPQPANDSDSDRTIDSDDLETMIGTMKETSPSNKLENNKQNIKDDNIIPVSQRSPHKSSSNSHVAEANSQMISKSGQNDSKPECPFGNKCYRKNPHHFREYSHPAQVAAENTQASGDPPENVFGFYMTKVAGIPDDFNHPNLAIGIKEILSSKWGKLLSSAQFNYMVDVRWLVEQYPPVFRDKPLLVVHGEQRAARVQLERSGKGFPNISFCQAKLEIMYGTHHTKMMLLRYETGLRVVVHTSNLVEGDWLQKSQGVWMSPVFPPLSAGPSLLKGDSDTRFKADLIQYLAAYHNPALEPWIDSVKAHDFSSARVFLIGSIPGRHVGTNKFLYGHLKLKKVLQTHCAAMFSSKWPLIGQFSSIGSLGSNPDQWLCKEFVQSLAASKGAQQTLMHMPQPQLIYPSVDNVRTSLEGYPAGSSLPYSHKVASKQPYLVSFLHQWKSQVRGRTRASPHIKTYCRFSPDYAKMAWFLVTSANLSKAAWGALEKDGSQLMIRSYELGVLFLPQFWESGNSFATSSRAPNNLVSFPLPYDVPPTKYGALDQPWIWDIPQVKAPDSNGMKWCPPI